MFINYCLLFAILDFARSQFINLDLDTNTTLIPSCSREKPKIIYYFNESNKTCWMPFSFILSYLPDDEQIVLYNSMMNNNDNSVCFNISTYQNNITNLRGNCSQGVEFLYEKFSFSFRYSFSCIKLYLGQIYQNDKFISDIYYIFTNSTLLSQSFYNTYAITFIQDLMNLSTFRRRWLFQTIKTITINCIYEKEDCKYFPFYSGEKSKIIDSFLNLIRINYYHSYNINTIFLKFQASLVNINNCINKISGLNKSIVYTAFSDKLSEIQSFINLIRNSTQNNYSRNDLLKYLTMSLHNNSVYTPFPDLHIVFQALLNKTANETAYNLTVKELSNTSNDILCNSDYIYLCNSSNSTCYNYTLNPLKPPLTTNLSFTNNTIFTYYISTGCINSIRYLYINMNTTVGDLNVYFSTNSTKLGENIISKIRDCSTAFQKKNYNDKEIQTCVGQIFNKYCDNIIHKLCYGNLGYYNFLGNNKIPLEIFPLDCNPNYIYYNQNDCFSYIINNFMLNYMQPYISAITKFNNFMLLNMSPATGNFRQSSSSRLIVNTDPSLQNSSLLFNQTNLLFNFSIDSCYGNAMANTSDYYSDIDTGISKLMMQNNLLSSSELLRVSFIILILYIFVA